MKLFAQIYPSPLDVEGTYNNVYIEDIGYEVKRNDNFFAIDFEMYHIKNGKRVKLDNARITFKGSNEEMDLGLPTTNKTATLLVTNPDYNPDIPSMLEIANPEYDANITPTIEVENPEYDSTIEGSLQTITVPNPEYKNPTLWINNPDYVPEKYETPLVQYLSTHEGVMPAIYEVINWGYPTYTNVLQYFEGGTLTNPELIITNPFAKEWLKHTLQMKGLYIHESFDFI